MLKNSRGLLPSGPARTCERTLERGHLRSRTQGDSSSDSTCEHSRRARRLRPSNRPHAQLSECRKLGDKEPGGRRPLAPRGCLSTRGLGAPNGFAGLDLLAAEPALVATAPPGWVRSKRWRCSARVAHGRLALAQMEDSSDWQKADSPGAAHLDEDRTGDVRLRSVKREIFSVERATDRVAEARVMLARLRAQDASRRRPVRAARDYCHEQRATTCRISVIRELARLLNAKAPREAEARGCLAQARQVGGTGPSWAALRWPRLKSPAGSHREDVRPDHVGERLGNTAQRIAGRCGQTPEPLTPPEDGDNPPIPGQSHQEAEWLRRGHPRRGRRRRAC